MKCLPGFGGLVLLQLNQNACQKACRRCTERRNDLDGMAGIRRIYPGFELVEKSAVSDETSIFQAKEDFAA